jgi:hypothetical protein
MAGITTWISRSFVAGEPVDGFERVQIAAGVREERRRRCGAERRPWLSMAGQLAA